MTPSSDLAFALGLNAAFALGVLLTVQAVFRRFDAADRRLAGVILGLTLLCVGLEILSLGTLVNRRGACLLAAATLSLGVALALWRRLGLRTNEPVEPPTRVAAIGKLALVGAALSLVIVGWGLLHFLVRAYLLPVETISDAPIYHLWFAVRWQQDGRISIVPTPFGELAASYFPANGSLWFTWLLLSTGNETWAKLGQAPFLLVNVCALYALGRRLGMNVAAALYPPLLWCSLPVVVLSFGIANVDLIFSGCYLTAAYFLYRWHEAPVATNDSRAFLFVFALAAGLALGTKSIGVPFVPLLIAPALVLMIASARRRAGTAGWRALGGELLLLTLGLAIPSAYWYGRNWLLTGNPLYPLDVQCFGRPLWHGWYTSAAMRNSGYHLDSADLRVLVDRFSLMFDGKIVLPLLTGVVAYLGSFAASQQRGRNDWFLLLACAIGATQAVLYWWVIPYNTQERFLLAALGLLLLPIGSLAQGRPWLQALLTGVIAAQWFTPRWFTDFARINPPVAAGLLVFSGGWEKWAYESALPLCVFVALGLLSLRRRWSVPAATASLIAGFAIAAYPGATALNQFPLARFYPVSDFGRKMFPAWERLERRRPDVKRVAYAGTNLPYYLCGSALKQYPQYINVNAHADWKLHDYHLERLREGKGGLADNPFPLWHREGADYGAWLANLRRAKIQYLFVARTNLYGQLDLPPGPAPFPIEYDWAEAHPEIFERLTPRTSAEEPQAIVYRVRPEVTTSSP